MGLAAIAARVAAAAATAMTVSAPIGLLDYGRIHYDILASNVSTGLGGLPPFCGPLDRDMVQVVYTVINNNDFALPANAIPRLVIIDPAGVVTRADRHFSDIVAQKVNPPMTMHNGALAAHARSVQADIFLTKKFETRNRPYRLRPLPEATRSINLPLVKREYTPECPQPSAPPVFDDR
jgi:hypothetical protein